MKSKLDLIGDIVKIFFISLAVGLVAPVVFFAFIWIPVICDLIFSFSASQTALVYLTFCFSISGLAFCAFIQELFEDKTEIYERNREIRWMRSRTYKLNKSLGGYSGRQSKNGDNK